MMIRRMGCQSINDPFKGALKSHALGEKMLLLRTAFIDLFADLLKEFQMNPRNIEAGIIR